MSEHRRSLCLANTSTYNQIDVIRLFSFHINHCEIVQSIFPTHKIECNIYCLLEQSTARYSHAMVDSR